MLRLLPPLRQDDSRRTDIKRAAMHVKQFSHVWKPAGFDAGDCPYLSLEGIKGDPDRLAGTYGAFEELPHDAVKRKANT
jgi:hypothetical protein